MSQKAQPEIHEAYERWDGERTPVVLLCEHASQILPEPWSWSDADQWHIYRGFKHLWGVLLTSFTNGAIFGDSKNREK